MKLMYPPAPDLEALASAEAELAAAVEAVAEANRISNAAYARKQHAEQALDTVKRPADYAAKFAELVEAAKAPGCVLIARPTRRWGGNESALVHEIACVFPGKIQCKGRRLWGSGSTTEETFYRRDGGRWATSRSQGDTGEWREVTDGR